MDDSLLGQNWCNQIHSKPCDSNLALSLDQVDFQVEKDLMVGGIGLKECWNFLPITKTYVSFFWAFCSGEMCTLISFKLISWRRTQMSEEIYDSFMMFFRATLDVLPCDIRRSLKVITTIVTHAQSFLKKWPEFVATTQVLECGGRTPSQIPSMTFYDFHHYISDSAAPVDISDYVNEITRYNMIWLYSSLWF